MSTINQLLQKGYGTFADGIPIQRILIEFGLTAQAKEMLEPLELGERLALVCDENTHTVLGQQLGEQLSAETLILPGDVKAEERIVEEIRIQTAEVDALVAVGSGTINDLCKYSSFQDNKPYVVFGTAPSMNGYASANASITVNGHKKTLTAHLPHAIFLDLDIMTTAPQRLIASGIGDALCRSTAQADWLLSHLLLDTPYDAKPFEWLKETEERLLKYLTQGRHSCESRNPNSPIKMDPSLGWDDARKTGWNSNIIKPLCENLVLSGLAMTVCDGSYPASQGEHMIAHTMEMLHGDSLPETYHGEQIAVTTLTMARLQEYIIEKQLTTENISFYKETILEHFGPEIGEQCIAEYEQKQLGEEQITALNAKLSTEWEEIAAKIHQIIVPRAQIKEKLQSAGAPITPEALQWPQEQYKEAIRLSAYTRSRFTFLDLALLSGNLEDFLKKI